MSEVDVYVFVLMYKFGVLSDDCRSLGGLIGQILYGETGGCESTNDAAQNSAKISVYPFYRYHNTRLYRLASIRNVSAVFPFTPGYSSFSGFASPSSHVPNPYEEPFFSFDTP